MHSFSSLISLLTALSASASETSANAVTTGADQMQMLEVQAGTGAEQRLQETLDRFSSFLGRSSPETHTPSAEKLPQTVANSSVTEGTTKTPQKASAIDQSTDGPKSVAMTNGDFNEGPYKCKVWTRSEEEDEKMNSEEWQKDVEDDDRQAQMYREKRDNQGETWEYKEPVFCDPAGWTNWIRRKKIKDDSWSLRKPYDYADEKFLRSDHGAFQVNLAKDPDTKAGPPGGRNEAFREQLVLPQDPMKPDKLIACESYKDCWWMVLLNNQAMKNAISETEIGGLTQGQDYTVAFDAARTPVKPCSGEEADSTHWLDVQLLVDGDVMKKESFTWPKFADCSGKLESKCSGLCEIQAQEKAYGRYYWNFKAPSSTVTLRFENVKHGDPTELFHVWFSHVRMYEGAVTAESEGFGPLATEDEEAKRVREEEADRLKEEQAVKDLEERARNAEQDLAAVRREYSSRRIKLDRSHAHQCFIDANVTECEAPGKPCIYNGRYCVAVVAAAPGMVNADFCKVSKGQDNPGVTDDDPKKLGWQFVKEITGWELADKDGSEISEESFFVGEQQDEQKWLQLLDAWHLPSTKSSHCLVGMVSGSLASKDAKSQVFLRQTLKNLQKKHRYFVSFKAAQSHASSTEWLMVQAVQKGSPTVSNVKEQWYHVSHMQFQDYRFVWIANGDEYDIEFISSFDNRPGEKSVIALTNMSLVYQESMNEHASLQTPPQARNTLLCNLRGLTQDYIGYSKSLSMEAIKQMLPQKFSLVCKKEWANSEFYKAHHAEVGCTSEDECVVCNAVALASILGWEWHRKALSQHFAELLQTPASVVLALLKHPSVFRHNSQTQGWLYDIERMLKEDDTMKNDAAPKCWGPKELEEAGASIEGTSALNQVLDASESESLIPLLLKNLDKALA